jgi:hypothetical protein
VKDYAHRTGFDLPTMEKWLAPSLAYDPDKEPKEEKSSPSAGKDSASPCGCGLIHP